MELLSCHSVAKTYPNGTVGLHRLDLSVAQGEIIGLVGPNGSGKSTTLNLLGGFLQSSKGTITLSAQRVGWCPQHTVIDWSLTALENASLLARLHGTSRRDAFSKAEKALQILGLENVRKTQAEYLSGGQLQRVQIARAICFDADLLLLDEPTTGLDVEGQEAVWNHLRAQKESGVGMLVSSHDLDALEQHCDRFVILRNGRIVFASTAEELTRAGASLRSAYRVGMEEQDV